MVASNNSGNPLDHNADRHDLEDQIEDDDLDLMDGDELDATLDLDDDDLDRGGDLDDDDLDDDMAELADEDTINEEIAPIVDVGDLGSDSGDSLESARRLVTFISDKKGEDVVVLDLRGITTLADYFVIASASSDRQLNAITDNIRVEGKKNFGRIPIRTEGKGENGWVLIDYSDVIVHLFSPESRAYYDLEGLWRDAPVVVRIQ